MIFMSRKVINYDHFTLKSHPTMTFSYIVVNFTTPLLCHRFIFYTSLCCCFPLLHITSFLFRIIYFIFKNIAYFVLWLQCWKTWWKLTPSFYGPSWDFWLFPNNPADLFFMTFSALYNPTRCCTSNESCPWVFCWRFCKFHLFRIKFYDFDTLSWAELSCGTISETMQRFPAKGVGWPLF